MPLGALATPQRFIAINRPWKNAETLMKAHNPRRSGYRLPKMRRSRAQLIVSRPSPNRALNTNFTERLSGINLFRDARTRHGAASQAGQR